MTAINKKKELLTQVLILGYEIRARCERAPFFGPQAAPDVQTVLWTEITHLRDELDALIHQIAGTEPNIWPMIKLEAEGCGENYHRGRATLEETWTGSEADKATHLERELDAALGVFLSRLEAIGGNDDPEHGVGSRNQQTSPQG